MIIVCPECQSRYKVAAEEVSVDGRVMKCYNCSHQCFQTGVGFQDILNDSDSENQDSLSPVDDEEDIDERLSAIEETLMAEDNNYIEDNFDGIIDDGPSDQDDIMPSENESVVEDKSSGRAEKQRPPEKTTSKKAKRTGGVATGAVAALFAFTVLFTALLVLKGRVLETIPSSKLVYSAMGFQTTSPGEGLVFDRVDPVWDGTKLVVEGQIINLLQQSSVLPRVELSFESETGEVLDSGIFLIGADLIEGEMPLPFDYEIQSTPDIKKETYAIRLSFLPVD